MLLSIIILAALAIFLISVDASWGNVLSAKRNNLVFEGRVQDYGAYVLRKEQPRTMMYAIFLTIGLVGGLVIISRVTTEAKKAIAPFVASGDWTEIVLPPIKTEKQEVEKPENPIQKPNTAAAAAAGDAQEGNVEVVEQEVKPQELIEKPGQGGSDDNKTHTPGGQPYGKGNGDGKNDGDDDSGQGNNFKIEEWAAKMPSFPGGEEAMLKYMKDRVKFSELDKERGATGTMYISFVVHTDGSITNIELIRNFTYGESLANKAIKAISEMPKWNPGMNGKIPVAVRYTMPMSFKLKNN